MPRNSKSVKRASQRLGHFAVAMCMMWAAACKSGASGPEAEPSPEAVLPLLAQADEFYKKREDLAQLRAAIAALRRARTIDYSNYEAAWKLAKFNYYLGEHTTDKEERDAAFREGIQAGEIAVRLQPDRPEGHFWLGANLGGRAEAQGALAGLTSVDDIRREMEAVIRIDESYQAGSAYMVLGQVEMKLPGMLGGNRKRAVELMERGLQFGAGNAFLRLRLAEAYLAAKRPDDARKQLNAILEMTPDPDYLPEYKEAAAEARRLLDEKLNARQGASKGTTTTP